MKNTYKGGTALPNQSCSREIQHYWGLFHRNPATPAPRPLRAVDTGLEITDNMALDWYDISPQRRANILSPGT